MAWGVQDGVVHWRLNQYPIARNGHSLGRLVETNHNPRKKDQRLGRYLPAIQ